MSTPTITRCPLPWGRLRRPRVVTPRTADRPPLVMLNRYPGQVIGIALRIGPRRQLSIVWARPDRWWTS